MQSYEGIYENGVVRPLTPLALPESTPVSILVPTVDPKTIGSNSDELYALLEERFESGYSDTAARVDELNP